MWSVVMSVPFVGSERVGPGVVGCVGRDRGERDQGDADVAQLLEQAVQRRLVDDRAADDGGAVVLVGEAQPVEPGRPAGSEVSLDPDLVLRRVGRISVGALLRTDLVRSSWSHRTVRIDLVSAHHTA